MINTNKFSIFILSLLIALAPTLSQAQTASILPNAQTTFVDKNGKPLTSGTVEFFIPGTTTHKMTWKDAGQTINNTNPVILDGSGRATIFGDGSYRQLLKDRYGNVIWDAYTSSAAGSGGGSTPTIGDGDAVGTVKAWSGFIAPYGYVFAYGQELVRASYPEAFATLTSNQNVTCTSGDPILTGIGSTSQLPIGAQIESSCLNSGATIVSKTINSVTASSNAIISTTTTARFFPFGNGDGNLTFNTPDLRGRVIAGNDGMGGISANRLTATYFGAGTSPNALGAVGGSQSHSIKKEEIPNYTLPTPTITQPTFNTNANVVTGSAAITYGGGSGPINVPTSWGGSTVTLNSPTSAVVTSGGSGDAMTLVQPTQTYNYIIKVIADTNPNSFFGVASIGGMYGVLECGTGITCAGNTISAVSSNVAPPSAVTLGGVFTKTCSSSNWFNTLDNTGTFGCSQPSFADLTGTASVSQGGTGATSFTANLPLVGNGTGAIAQGTRSGNTTKFASVNGSLVSGNCLSVDASGNVIDDGSPCAGSATNPFYVADRTALKAVNSGAITSAYLAESGRQGIFNFNSSNLSANITIDTNEGVYIAPASDPTGASGAWVRAFDFSNYETSWFGAVADYSTDNSTLINNMIAVSNIPNTNPNPGKQRAAFINVGGGVKFATKNLTWLPATNWIFVYVNYFANSNTTPGEGGGRGTNERATLSVNSGFPTDVTGGYVAENLFHTPLHPAIGVNIDKNVDSSIVAHLPTNQQIQPTATYSAKGSSAWISDEYLEKFRIMYQQYGTLESTNGVIFYFTKRKTDLIVTNGGVAAGWAGSAVPVAGDVVRDVTTGARYIVTSLATSVITTDWLSGAAVPGDNLLRERAIFRGSISGTVLTVTAMDQGSISTGHTLVGMFSGSGVTGGTTIVSQSSGTPGGVGVYIVNNSQTVAATQLVTGNLSVNNIQGGGVSNTDTSYRPISIYNDGADAGKVVFNQSSLPGTLSSFSNGAGASTGTLNNAPIAGNPTKWISINDAGTIRRIPAW